MLEWLYAGERARIPARICGLVVEAPMRQDIWHQRWYHTPIQKTTIYLPDELKAAVRRLAAASGRSEAEVIREAVRRMTAAAQRPRPRGALFASGDPYLSEQTEEALSGFGER